jgi:transketolase
MPTNSVHNLDELKAEALQTRRIVLQTLHGSQAGHPGGSLSAVEIFVALYWRILRIDPFKPDWEDRDRFILSKGHAAPVYYVTLARRGYFSESDLATYDTIDSRLQGHPDMRKTPGVDMSSGSLGQGLSVAVGLALGANMAKRDYHVYCLLGDGECQEGQIWEAAMSASKFRLDNLTAIVDWNGLQLMGTISETMPMPNMADNWRSFGWEAVELDGHDLAEITAALEASRKPGTPRVLLARTVKGKGVSFMENKVEWHARPVSSLELQQALAELTEVES